MNHEAFRGIMEWYHPKLVYDITGATDRNLAYRKILRRLGMPEPSGGELFEHVYARIIKRADELKGKDSP